MSMWLNDLQASLQTDDSDVNRRQWARRLSDEQVNMRDLLRLLDTDRFTKLRFLWMVGGLAEIDPALLQAVVPDLFAKRQSIGVPNYNRTLAKLFWLCGIPETIEADAVNELFGWILDTKSNTTTKSFAVLALHRLTAKYPDLKQELILVIEDQLGKNGVSFDQRAGKILAQLKGGG